MDRFDRILGVGKQSKIKSSIKLPTRAEGQNGDMMIVNGQFLIKDRNFWYRFNSNNESADGEITNNVTIEQTNITSEGVLSHGALTGVNSDNHHSQAHTIGGADHSDVTGKTGTGNVVLSANSELTGDTDIANVNTGSVKAADGSASFTIADSTGILTVGNLVVTGDFDVGGTETINNSTTVAITDLDFRIASNAADSNAADGAGFEVGDGGDVAKIQYNHNGGTPKWDWDIPIDMGSNSLTTSTLIADNITIDGNSITSTNGNGAINLTPNGTGSVVISKVDIANGEIDGTVIGASSAANGTFSTLSATTLGAALNHNNENSTNVDIDSGAIDGTTIGADNATTIIGTEIDAENDFTVGNTVITSGQIANTEAFKIVTGDQATDDFIINNGNRNILVVEGDNERIGIGTNAPLVPLHVEFTDAQSNEGLFLNCLDGIHADIIMADDTGSTRLRNADGQFSIYTGGDANSYDANDATRYLTVETNGDVYITQQIQLGHTTDTTLARLNAGDVTIEGNVIYRAGCGLAEGVIPVPDGGTNTATLAPDSVLVSQDDGAAQMKVNSKPMDTDGYLLIGGSANGPETNLLNNGDEFSQGINIINGENEVKVEIELAPLNPCLKFTDEKLDTKINTTSSNKKLKKELTGIAIDESILPYWEGTHRFFDSINVTAENDESIAMAGIYAATGGFLPHSKWPILVQVEETSGKFFSMGRDAMQGCYSAVGGWKEVDTGDAHYDNWT